MTARANGWRLFVVAVIAAGALAALTLAPRPAGADAPVAQSADKAGDDYDTAVKKAQETRAAKLRQCANKPTKAKRTACKKAANAKFKKAKAKAKAKRDKSRRNGGGDDRGGSRDDGPASPRDQRDEFTDCMEDGGSVIECKAESRGGKPGR